MIIKINPGNLPDNKEGESILAGSATAATQSQYKYFVRQERSTPLTFLVLQKHDTQLHIILNSILIYNSRTDTRENHIKKITC